LTVAIQIGPNRRNAFHHPLARDGEIVDMILAITIHSSRPAKEGSNTESQFFQDFPAFVGGEPKFGLGQSPMPLAGLTSAAA
jgi:hypothetical protein